MSSHRCQYFRLFRYIGALPNSRKVKQGFQDTKQSFLQRQCGLIFADEHDGELYTTILANDTNSTSKDMPEIHNAHVDFPPELSDK